MPYRRQWNVRRSSPRAIGDGRRRARHPRGPERRCRRRCRSTGADGTRRRACRTYGRHHPRARIRGSGAARARLEQDGDLVERRTLRPPRRRPLELRARETHAARPARARSARRPPNQGRARKGGGRRRLRACPPPPAPRASPGQVPPEPERLVKLVAPEEVDTLVGAALIGSPLFATRFRHAAIRALYIPRMFRGARTPAYLQRLKADALLEAVGGRAEFPVVAETLRECFNDAFDVPRLKRLLERIHDGELWTRHVDTPLPSPFVYPLLLAWDWAYLDAGHAEERRSDAVVMRKAWSVTAGPLRADIVAAVEAGLQQTTPERRARDANELAGILDHLGGLTTAEVAERALGDADGLIAALHGERRGGQVQFASGRPAWVAPAR